MSENVSHETVLDTGAEQLGKTYARALVAAAQGSGATDTVVQQLRQLCEEVLANNPNLHAAFASPRISEDEKARVIDRLLGSSYHPVLVKFLKVMARRGRLGHVAAVSRAADGIYDEMMGRVVASIRTAVPLDNVLREQIVQRLSSVLNREVKLRESVDPQLIGGMVIRIGDRVFDSSVSTRLDKMSRKVRAGFAGRLMQSFESFTTN
jgi:F-type H+-transporting ATPase subunit delta